MSYDRTLLFSASQAVSACTLSQPASAFEHIVIGTNDNRIYRECYINSDYVYNHIPISFGQWSSFAYTVWPYSMKVTNGTTNLNLVQFQLLEQGGSAQPRTLGSTGNSANNIKKIRTVYGVNTKNHSTITGLGSPGEGWREYDETLLWSAYDDTTQKQSTIQLSQPVSSFERLKIKTGAVDGLETTYTYEVGVPVNSTAWLPLESYWGNSVNSYYFSLHRYRFSGYDKIMPISGKSFQLGTAAANPYTTTGIYTSTDKYVRYPVNAIWGINSKY